MPGSTKARLALQALEEFGVNGYEDVSVVDLAARAGVTTGSLYHHFGSKAGLYNIVRAEIEQRLIDRMEAALETAEDGIAAALRVAFDATVRFKAARMLSEEHPTRDEDPVTEVLARASDVVRAELLMAAWRAALRLVAEDSARPDVVRDAIAHLVRSGRSEDQVPPHTSSAAT